MIDGVDETAETVIGVGISIRRIRRSDSCVSKTAADDDGKAGWNNNTPPSQDVNLPKRCCSREVTVVVCRHRAPTTGVR